VKAIAQSSGDRLEIKTQFPLLPPVIKFMRMVWLWMIASVFLFASVAEMSARTMRRPPVRVFEVIAGVAVALAISWIVVRRKYVGEGANVLARDPSDARALRRWRTGHIISYVISEAVALYGLNLRYMGFTFRDVTAFYLAGLVLMLFSWPKMPIVSAGTS
jgi:F0F1-type ATP synthase membrane subunit c/vacuolar-type H+-ATPase subunit K